MSASRSFGGFFFWPSSSSVSRCERSARCVARLGSAALTNDGEAVFVHDRVVRLARLGGDAHPLDVAEVATLGPRSDFGPEHVREGAGRAGLTRRGARTDVRARQSGTERSVAPDLRGLDELGDRIVGGGGGQQRRDEVGGALGVRPASRIRERGGRVVDVGARPLGREGGDDEDGARERKRRVVPSERVGRER